MVQRSTGNPPQVGAAGVTPPDGEDNNTDGPQRLGQAVVNMMNRMEEGPSTIPGDMVNHGLLGAAVGAGVAAVGAALDSRALTAGGLAGTALGLALAAYGSRGVDQATVQNREAIQQMAHLTASLAEGLGAQAGEGAEAPADEAPPVEGPQGEEKPKDPPSES